jgi:hypothetical protein
MIVNPASVSHATGQNFRKRPEPRYVRLDFIGRRTAVSGRYGHMGLSVHYVVVDRIISARIADDPR